MTKSHSRWDTRAASQACVLGREGLTGAEGRTVLSDLGPDPLEGTSLNENHGAITASRL